MADYDEALRIEANDPSIWVSRGNEWRRDLKLDEAIADYTHAIQLNPRYARRTSHEETSGSNGELSIGRSRNSRYLIRMDPQNALAHQTLARILATCHEAKFPQRQAGRRARQLGL